MGGSGPTQWASVLLNDGRRCLRAQRHEIRAPQIGSTTPRPGDVVRVQGIGCGRGKWFTAMLHSIDAYGCCSVVYADGIVARGIPRHLIRANKRNAPRERPAGVPVLVRVANDAVQACAYITKVNPDGTCVAEYADGVPAGLVTRDHIARPTSNLSVENHSDSSDDISVGSCVIVGGDEGLSSTALADVTAENDDATLVVTYYDGAPAGNCFADELSVRTREFMCKHHSCASITFRFSILSPMCESSPSRCHLRVLLGKEKSCHITLASSHIHLYHADDTRIECGRWLHTTWRWCRNFDGCRHLIGLQTNGRSNCSSVEQWLC